MVGLLIGVALAAAFLGEAALAQDANAYRSIETKYIFGNFTVGASTDKAGDKGFEIESESDFTKRGGRYFANETALEFEYSPTNELQIEAGPTVSFYDIHGVPGLDERSTAVLNGFEADFRYAILPRGDWPFALTASVEPEFHSHDETGGDKVLNYGLESRLEADTELIKNRLYLGFNLLYEPETTRAAAGGPWESESTIGGSSALGFRITPDVVIGADLWYLRHYEGATFDSFTGDAVFLGPTVYWHIKHHMLMSAAFETQVAGHEVVLPANLDLTDFSRNRARFLFEIEF